MTKIILVLIYTSLLPPAFGPKIVKREYSMPDRTTCERKAKLVVTRVRWGRMQAYCQVVKA